MGRVYLLVIAICLASAAAANAAVVELQSPQLSELLVAGFALDQAGTVVVDAQGALPPRRNERRSWIEQWAHGDETDRSDGCFAWILDEKSRKAVWVLDLNEAPAGDAADLRRERVRLDLDAGHYQLLLFGGHGGLAAFAESKKDSARALLEEAERNLTRCSATVTADGLRPHDATGRIDGAVFALIGMGDLAFEEQAFEVTATTKVQVYGVGEQSGRSVSDFGWLADLDTGRRLLDMSARRGRRAGGASKNRVLQRSLALEPGRYVLAYGTDGSHSLASFNAAPPVDPLAWGIQLSVSDPSDATRLRPIDRPALPSASIAFTEVGDDGFRAQAFRMNTDGIVHVRALGEATSGGWDWADRGWIVDPLAHEVVWAMDHRDCVAAGGSPKNRLFDGWLRLKAGTYVAYYVSDSSHSYPDWNSAKPFEEKDWGMQIYPADENSFELVGVESIDESPDVLVSLTRVGNSETRRERFTLDAPAVVEIHSIGEGDEEDMFDRGYVVEVETGRRVWEMEFRDSYAAGGAVKNREVLERVELDAGEYEAVYLSDDSHAFGSWNASAPDDPLSWGMSVRLLSPGR